MNGIGRIAIIIPAYKSDFLQEAIESVLEQQDNNYRLYIFNDDSPDERVDTICRSFAGHPRVVYFHFEENLGSKSLPAHWNRCIRKTDNEEWVWLFSDDDLMDENCVRRFRRTQQLHSDFHLFRFNTVKFKDESLLRRNELPFRMSLQDWLRLKLTYRIESYVVECIFRRSLFEQIGGFADFPLGWCADDWFWIETMLHTDMVTIDDAWVYWRYSNANISGIENTPETASLKMKACCLLLNKVSDVTPVLRHKEIRLLLAGWGHKQLLYLHRSLSSDQAELFRETIDNLLLPE